jgi:hypothetical protein
MYTITPNHHAEKVRARMIANMWHDGQGSALYSFATTGLLLRVDRMIGEIGDCLAIAAANQEPTDELHELRRWTLQFIL